MKMKFKMENFIGILVVLCWTASVIAEIIILDYNTSFYIHFLMAAIVGAYYDGSKYMEIFKRK